MKYKTFDEAFRALNYGEEVTDEKVLTLRHSSGITIAHEVAKRGVEISNEEVLKLADEKGWTVAHDAVANGSRLVLIPTILTLKTKADLISVAYFVAKKNPLSLVKGFSLLKPNRLSKVTRKQSASFVKFFNSKSLEQFQLPCYLR